jgi:toxin ParE1/3/4
VRLEWRPAAEEDALDILRYIAADNPAAAEEVFGQIRAQVGRLAHHPQMGRVGRVEGTRELVIARTPYIAVYRVRSDTVQVLRVLHGAQQWPPIRR